jgi:hypothetical protein
MADIDGTEEEPMAENFTRIDGRGIHWIGCTGTGNAVEVGLKPGDWPETIAVSKGEADVVLSQHEVRRVEGSIVEAVYRSGKFFGIRHYLTLQAVAN